MKLFLIRHGETEKNVVNKLHGIGDIESLTEIGKKQIELTGEVLKSEGIVKIFYSNELRAKDSAVILSESLKCDVVEDRGLGDRNWGDFTDKPWSDVKEVLDPMTLEERYNYTPPNGESWKDFESRLITALHRAIDQSQNSNLVIVTHAAVIRALIPYLLKVSKEESFKYDPANASISEFEYDGMVFKQVRIDDISHLNH